MDLHPDGPSHHTVVTQTQDGSDPVVMLMEKKNRPEELGGSLHHLQPHRRHTALIEERGLRESSESVQRLLQELTAQIGIIS